MSRAAPDTHEIDKRILRVLDMVSSGEFIAGASHRLLQDEWGVSASTVSTTVASAFRMHRMFRPGFEDDLNRRLAAIEEDRRLASKRMKYFAHQGTVCDERADPDVASMLAADRLYLETIGALVRARERNSGDEPTDIQALIRVELSGNPALLRTVLGMMPAGERAALLAPILTQGVEVP